MKNLLQFRSAGILLVVIFTALVLFVIVQASSQRDGSSESAPQSPSSAALNQALSGSSLATTSSSVTTSSSSLSPSSVSSPASVTAEDNKKPKSEIESYIAGMSLEEKAAALFMTSPGYTGGLPVGGLLFWGVDVKTSEQVKRDISSYKASSPIPLWIGADEEGGTVTRLGVLPEFPRTDAAVIMGRRAPGEEGDVSSSYKTIGASMRELGFNVNFAPVADVLTNIYNAEIGSRSFGEDPAHVARCVNDAISALASEGILAVPKHFPGQGGTAGNTHLSSVTLERSLDELMSVELVPYSSAFGGGAKAVMVGHISLPKISNDNTPSCLSRDVVTGLLRERLGFRGVVFTDALNMRPITTSYSQAEAAVAAIKAGCDVLVAPADISAAHKGIVEAVNSGDLDESVIDESLLRQFKIKWKYKS